jgi:uncharacterized protein
MRRIKDLPTVTGLAIALFGPVVAFVPVHKMLGEPQSFTARAVDQLVLWALFGLIVAIVVLWEKRPLSSIGLRWRWSSIVWGLALAAVFILLVSPIQLWVLAQTGLPGFEAGFAGLSELPIWFLVAATLSAGVVEETLYRGYAIERLGPCLGYVTAGLITMTVHTLAHLPAWGWGPTLSFFVPGIVITAFYLWRRDLLACIVAHATTDTVGIIFWQPVAV